MKVEILSKVENPLLKRVELRFTVDHSGAATPKRLEVRGELASQLGVPEDAVVIDKISSVHGEQTASGTARAYGSKEDMESMEREYLRKRGMPKEVPEEKPAEAPKKEEKAQAEKKEAPKEEAKAQEKPKEEKAPEKKEG
ncbi:MAG: 30S ribosomal protein S24e [Candidatus Hadarchaeota archaeon]